MNSKAVLSAGVVMLTAGTFALGLAAGGSAEAASPTTVTINYVAEGNCGRVEGGGSARVTDRTMSQRDPLRSCTATFRVLK